MNADTIVTQMPEGYRIATPVEAARANHPAYFSRMVQVERGRLGPVGKAPKIFTDFAIKA